LKWRMGMHIVMVAVNVDEEGKAQKGRRGLSE
jgi:hypothetical protein